ncbi:MAG: exodeoxyribonuclease VII large subunit [Candidatus Pacebacteria bacterium]|nr:exodeoxyribonuclease VII large subunit [Candidatus Paceibacterota bacterium]MDD5013259.1 exodeoxyribonuclease VII large subunit [Candidatus Paceibacterota bacterium]
MKENKSFLRETLEKNTFSVSAYLDILNTLLSSCKTKIAGEVTELKRASSGHVYFSLKDKKDGSVLSCVIWSSVYRFCGVELKEGLEVKVFGYADIYKPTGRINFKCSSVELMGEGQLKKQYEELKNKLEKEGLFEESRKKMIPDYPCRIGIITSKEGAVINDFLNNLGCYGFKIKLVDSRVEGIEAVKDLLNALKTIKKQELDCLVIMRGGGSLESFLAFNNEVLIREVSKLSIPVIVALGHDKDVPLLALMADKMVSTPTAAANLLNNSWQRLEWEIKEKETTIFSFLSSFFEKVNLLEYKIKETLPRIIENRINNLKAVINNAENIISNNNPERNLSLGYSIIRKSGKIIKSINSVKENDLIDLQVVDGIINTEVKTKGLRKNNL